jgi:hypothetical protein
MEPNQPWATIEMTANTARMIGNIFMQNLDQLYAVAPVPILSLPWHQVDIPSESQKCPRPRRSVASPEAKPELPYMMECKKRRATIAAGLNIEV